MSVFREDCFLENLHFTENSTSESFNDNCGCYQCTGMSIVFLFLGMVLGMLLQKHGEYLRLGPGINVQSELFESSQLEPEYGLIVDSMKTETEAYLDGVENNEVFGDEFHDKHAWRRRDSQSSEYSHSSCVVNFTKSMLSLRGTLFANSMRKLSTMSGRQHGLIEARGKVRTVSISLCQE
jgi:hypothetical protein